MKSILNSGLFGLLFFGLSLGSCAQEDKSERESPPATATGKIGDVNVTVNYSSPSVKGRTIWGELVPYKRVWRTGANEATTVEFSGDVKVEGKLLKEGKYGLFTIPGQKKWTVIFNSVYDQWGAYDYDQGKDVLRVEVVPGQMPENVERMKFEVENDMIVLSWEKLKLPVQVTAE